MDVIEPKQLREAQEIFRELLKRESKERDFQNFFAQHPHKDVMQRALYDLEKRVNALEKS